MADGRCDDCGMRCAVIVAGFLINRVQTSGLFDPLLVAHVFVVITGYFTALMCGAVGGAFVLQRSFQEIPPQKSEGSHDRLLACMSLWGCSRLLELSLARFGLMPSGTLTGNGI